MQNTILVSDSIKKNIQEFMYNSFDLKKLVSKKVKETIIENFNEGKKILNENINIIILITYNMGNYPFITQEDLLKDIKDKLDKVITVDDLKKFNKIIRENNFIQEVIVNYGLGKKYWKNTIIPISNSGSIKNTLEKKFNYPFRVDFILVCHACLNVYFVAEIIRQNMKEQHWI